MRRAAYQRYLASREWALLKAAVRRRSGGTCERCHAAPHDETHHLTYERIGQERLEDLLGVCEPCHEFLSGKRSEDPRTRRARVRRLPRRVRPARLPVAEPAVLLLLLIRSVEVSTGLLYSRSVAVSLHAVRAAG